MNSITVNGTLVGTLVGTIVIIVIIVIIAASVKCNLAGATARPSPTIKCRPGECCKTVFINQNYTETDLVKAIQALGMWATNLAANKRRNNKPEAFGQPSENSCASPITICAINGTSRDAFEKQYVETVSAFKMLFDRTYRHKWYRRG